MERGRGLGVALALSALLLLACLVATMAETSRLPPRLPGRISKVSPPPPGSCIWRSVHLRVNSCNLPFPLPIAEVGRADQHGVTLARH
jgi:hypothetical protein